MLPLCRALSRARVAFSEARLTVTSATPGTSWSAWVTWDTQAAQVMPVTGIVRRSSVWVWLVVWAAWAVWAGIADPV